MPCLNRMYRYSRDDKNCLDDITADLAFKEGNQLDSIYQQIASLAKRYGAQKVILFGSRARGDYRPTSDIDLAVYGIPQTLQPDFWLEMEKLPTLLKFDIVYIQPETNPQLLKNIKQDGVILYAKD